MVEDTPDEITGAVEDKREEMLEATREPAYLHSVVGGTLELAETVEAPGAVDAVSPINGDGRPQLLHVQLKRACSCQVTSPTR